MKVQRHLVLCADGTDQITVMAAEVIQGHDSSMLDNDVNDGLGNSSLIESCLSMLSQFLFMEWTRHVCNNHEIGCNIKHCVWYLLGKIMSMRKGS